MMSQDDYERKIINQVRGHYNCSEQRCRSCYTRDLAVTRGHIDDHGNWLTTSPLYREVAK